MYDARPAARCGWFGVLQGSGRKGRAEEPRKEWIGGRKEQRRGGDNDRADEMAGTRERRKRRNARRRGATEQKR